MVLAMVPVMASAAPGASVDYVALNGKYDIGTGFAEAVSTASPEQSVSDSGSGSGSYFWDAEAGDQQIWLGLNDYTGQYQLKYYQLRAIGEYAEIWVSTNLAYPAGDPRPTPVVTDEQVAYLLAQVDDNIYLTMTQYFAVPDYHDGENAWLPSLVGNAYGIVQEYYEGDRMVILVDNVRDNNYYDPTYPNYIAGFYSPTYERYFDRNVITIDSHDWANRMGPDASRPYLYEGIIAHEMQHLIHDDVDGDEETFVNEGFADFAMLVCGYGLAVNSHLESAAFYAENSLVAWEDQGGLEVLADYGQAYLWTLYLFEQYGEAFIKHLFNNQDNGIAGIESSLGAFGSERDFAEVYHDFSIAMLIDDANAGPEYVFLGVDFNVDMGTYDEQNPETYSTPGAPAWGTDYLWLHGSPGPFSTLWFDGEDYSSHPTDWTSVDGMLWSGGGDLQDRWAIFEGVGGGTLSFDTMWDIEDYWDFGMVQVSTNGGMTWTSLSNAYTTGDFDPDAHPDIIANLPGLTGIQASMVTMSFDLSAYAGQDILLAFRYMTDWATYYEGWYIDNVYLDDVLVSDGTDASVFKDLSELFPTENDFSVTIVGMKIVKGKMTYQIIDLNLDDATETGMYDMSGVFKSCTKVIMLVTSMAPEGFTNYAMYDFGIAYSNGKK
jgi:hypothetical protein